MSGRADTPTPEFVGNSRVRGARSPPGTPRDLTAPSRAHLGPAAGHTDQPGDFARAKWRSVPPAGLLHGKAEKRRLPDFTRAKSESPVPGWTFPEQSGEVCRPPDFRRAKSESVPGGGSGRRVGVPARAAKNRPPGEKKPGFFRPLRACIRKRGLLFRKKNR